MTDPLASLDATAQAALVRRGEASPRELVQAAIDRIERTNPVLNAVITERFDAALAEAATVDRAAPFAGVPFLAKDAGLTMAGEPYSSGLQPLVDSGYRTPDDTEAAIRFRRAGFICLGRTNVPQLCTSLTTEPLSQGPTHNPWDTGMTTGGSSGGSAAAVASGMVPLAHANDGAGSIRVPAAYCGVVGLKPTRGRVSVGPGSGERWAGLSHEFGIARTVRDVAALLDVLEGRTWGDPYAAAPPARPFADEVGAPPGRLRIRVVRHLERQATDPEIVAAVDRTARVLADLGHEVADGEVPELDEAQGWGSVVAVSAAREIARLSAAAGVPIEIEDLEPVVAWLVDLGRRTSALEYQDEVGVMHAYSRRLEARWADFDLLLTPTVALPQFPLGENAPLADIAAMSARLAIRTIFTAKFNASGQPAVSLPLDETASGLPIGVQLVAATAREDLLLRVAAQLEEARPWAGRRPAIFG